ncbi:MAG: hypothetical protein JO273_13230, partial [Methylobacteriaceae bacterium]|nr:hypothetical protein [Methylobacteriaceae bacterium]
MGDNDPAAPASDEVSDTAGLEAGRTLANLGALGATDAAPAGALAFAAGAGVSFDLSRAQAFLAACMSANPRVAYGLGKKAPWLGAVPGRDFTQIDCSGFVREAVRLSTAPTLQFPDGSVVQHDWVRAHGFERSSIADAKASDGVVRIAFLRPQDSGEGIGHVVLVAEGKTIESHGHVGPDARAWTGTDWQAKAFVYVFARDGRLALPSTSESFAAAQAAAPTFTVRHGHRYAAEIVLSGIESFFASNAQIEVRLQGYGFSDVTVTGSGLIRSAEATWSGADTTAPIDPHLRSIREIPLAPPGDAPARAAAVAAPVVIRASAGPPVVPGPSHVFATAGLPKYHERVLAVRMRPEPMDEAPREAANVGAAAAMALAQTESEPETAGMSALSYYDRAGKVERVTSLRGRAAVPHRRAPAVAALTVASASTGPADDIDRIKIIELRSGQDTEALHQALAKDPTVADVSRVAARYLLGRRPVSTAPMNATPAIEAHPPLWNLSKIRWPEAREIEGFHDADEIT